MVTIYKLFNLIDEDTIQIYGTYGGLHIRGMAYRVYVTGNTSKVWHYRLTVLNKEKQMIKINSSPKNGTLTNTISLYDKILSLCEELNNKEI